MKIMKWISIAILFPALFWGAHEGYQLALQFVVPAGAVLVAWEGARSGKYVWAIGFVAIAILFNPFQPLTFSRGMFLCLNLVSIAAFYASLIVLKAKPGLAMQSIDV
ncbi:MAG: DUF6804 family protein [bacterium]